MLVPRMVRRSVVLIALAAPALAALPPGKAPDLVLEDLVIDVHGDGKLSARVTVSNRGAPMRLDTAVKLQCNPPGSGGKLVDVGRPVPVRAEELNKGEKRVVKFDDVPPGTVPFALKLPVRAVVDFNDQVDEATTDGRAGEKNNALWRTLESYGPHVTAGPIEITDADDGKLKATCWFTNRSKVKAPGFTVVFEAGVQPAGADEPEAWEEIAKDPFDEFGAFRGDDDWHKPFEKTFGIKDAWQGKALWLRVRPEFSGSGTGGQLEPKRLEMQRNYRIVAKNSPPDIIVDGVSIREDKERGGFRIRPVLLNAGATDTGQFWCGLFHPGSDKPIQEQLHNNIPASKTRVAGREARGQEFFYRVDNPQGQSIVLNFEADIRKSVPEPGDGGAAKPDGAQVASRFGNGPDNTRRIFLKAHNAADRGVELKITGLRAYFDDGKLWVGGNIVNRKADPAEGVELDWWINGKSRKKATLKKDIAGHGHRYLEDVAIAGIPNDRPAKVELHVKCAAARAEEETEAIPRADSAGLMLPYTALRLVDRQEGKPGSQGIPDAVGGKIQVINVGQKPNGPFTIEARLGESTAVYRPAKDDEKVGIRDQVYVEMEPPLPIPQSLYERFAQVEFTLKPKYLTDVATPQAATHTSQPIWLPRKLSERQFDLAIELLKTAQRAGKQVEVFADVTNRGPAGSVGCGVYFKINGVKQDEIDLRSLLPNESDRVSVKYTPKPKDTALEVEVELGPNAHLLGDSQSTNNVAEQTVVIDAPARRSGPFGPRPR